MASATTACYTLAVQHRPTTRKPYGFALVLCLIAGALVWAALIWLLA